MWLNHSNTTFTIDLYICYIQQHWFHHSQLQVQAWLRWKGLVVLKVNMWYQIWIFSGDCFKCVWMLWLRACGGSCPLQCVPGSRKTKEQKECWTAASVLTVQARAGSECHSCIKLFHTLYNIVYVCVCVCLRACVCQQQREREWWKGSVLMLLCFASQMVDKGEAFQSVPHHDFACSMLTLHSLSGISKV